ncbi:MAG: carboxypeptidase regulatory-like domain-containing protein [Gemmatimonadetes bacterium]|nr:carboxypeptidase regulatory-like domain-containing protein [Gemmatimonadota bacterium]
MIRTSTCSSAFSGVFVAAVAVAAVLGGTASSVAAQSLSGQVDRPGRWLVSVHSGDRLVAETISAPDGTFTVSAPAGRYGVAVAAVDTEVTLEAVEWGETGLADWSIAAPDPAPPLPSGSFADRCTLRPAADSPAGMAWLRARRAFALARLGLEEGGLVVDALVFERELGDDGRSVLRESPTERRDGVTRLTPRADPQDLVTRGFVREEEDGGYRFYGVDPELLLSDAFADTHCLRVRPDGGPALVALAFEPVERDRDRPDVEGVIWIERASGHPVLIEFGYRNFDLGIPLGGVGGRTSMVRLPDGSWVVAESWLRMPLLEVAEDPESELSPRWGLRGVREEGFRLTAVRSEAEGWNLGGEAGVIEGTVTVHAGDDVLEGARVLLPGTPYGAVTDARGRYRFDGLLDGVYEIVAEHPRLDVLPVGAAGRVTVERGRVARFDLSAPDPDAAARQLCQAAQTTGPYVILSGQVIDSLTSEPLAGVPLTLRFRDPRRSGSPQFQTQVFSGTGGEYLYCDLPPQTEVRVRADTPGADGRSDVTLLTGRQQTIRRDITVALSTEQGPSGVFGMVRDASTGDPLEAAQVRIQDMAVSVLTNRNGFFSFSDLPQGLYVLEVGTLGYRSREIVVRLAGSGAYKVDVDLSVEAITLEGITVTAVPRRLFGDMVDMQRRMELGFGDFVMKEELERRGGSLATALQGQSGVRVVTGAGNFRERYIVLRNGRDLPGGGVAVGAVDARLGGGGANTAETFCYPAVYVDGSSWSRPKAGGVGHDPVDFSQFYTMDIEALEIYKGAGSVPGEFGGGDAACGAIVVWTRRGGVTIRGTARGGRGGGGETPGAAPGSLEP